MDLSTPMEIYIPTLGRAHRQITLHGLPKAWQKRVFLVVQDADYWENKTEYDKLHKMVRGIVLLPKEITTIAPTRKFIMETATDPTVVMLDDDLVFSRRRADEPTKFEAMENKDYDEMFDQLAHLLQRYAHAGVSHREGANRKTEEFVKCSRQMRVMGYNRDLVNAHGVEFGRIEVMEDFDVCLQLLRKGETNILLNNWVHNQSGSDAEGGCSTFRTPAVQAECTKQLSKLHPGFVKIRTVPAKGGWGYDRVDVTISWKKAYESSQA